MFITDTKCIIYTIMVKFTHIPFQGIRKIKHQLWGNMLYRSWRETEVKTLMQVFLGGRKYSNKWPHEQV